MQDAAFPRNAWYALGWKEEAGRKLSHRKICGVDIVYYRTSQGKVAALEDACWHRLVPLSKGKLEGDTVVCPYHGLKYEAGGRCVHMPTQDTINPSACVRSFPVEERHRLIWVWPGDPQKADPDKIPDMWRLDHKDWAGDGGVIHGKCNYQLVLDNLMDLTHETFVHDGSIGNAAVAEAPFEASHQDETATITRWMIGIDPPPFWRAQYGKPGDVDRWQIIHFSAPSTIQIDVGVAETGTGAPIGDRSKGVTAFVINTITPETDKTCHYFWAFVRDYRIDDQSVTNATRDGVRNVFREDEEILEAQQQAMDAQPDKEFYNLNIDVGAMWSRRINERLVKEEQSIE
ncbi:MAG: aromatic ring-hydroxylating dioxygenase subunit alpha, partial [Sneathiellales bacterium]|nr:aromatic ring-hydroxylating dioxygenase subunit alpha [Sneathiellales bacterium]